MTIGATQASIERRERGFFFAMTLLIGLLLIGAFGTRVVIGEASFTRLPWWFHLHAVPMVAWVGLLTYQAWLVWHGEISAHRRVGWFGAGLAVYMVISGWIFAPVTVMWRGAGSPEDVAFQVGFLMTNLINITAFGLFVLAAILLRTRTEWHRRLMLSATLLIAGVAWFRVASLLGSRDPFLSTELLVTAHFALIMIGDVIITGRFRPVWLLGNAVWWLNVSLTGVLTTSAIGIAAGQVMFG